MATPSKTALVTGGAKRIGLAISENLAANGWTLAIHCNSSAAAGNDLAERIRAKGGKAHVVVADLGDHDAVQGIVPEAVEALGPIDLLVNNASIFEADEITTTSEAVWDMHMAINLKAPSFLVQAFAKQLPDGMAGNVVNIIDQRVLKITPEFYSYQLTKSALWVATRTLAQALAPNIRVNAISPGPTIQNARQSPEDFQAQLDGILLKKGAKLEEFGNTIRYLVETPSITGQMICLDGGQHLAWETPDVAGIAE